MMLSLPADARERWGINLGVFYTTLSIPYPGHLRYAPMPVSNQCGKSDVAEPALRTSSITTELPLMTYIHPID